MASTKPGAVQGLVQCFLNKAKYVLAISECTRNDLHRLLPKTRGKTVVTLLAARRFSSQMPRALTQDQSESRSYRYVLFVGTIEPRKNLERLIAAWRSIAPLDRGDTQLVIAGATGWLIDNMLRKSADDAIVFKGFVGDDDLAELMCGATAFVYPSLYEGFGLPILEAMAQGIPVLTSNVGATREVADGAALLVDPASIPSIREGLLRLLKDDALRVQLSRLGLERVSAFSWERTAAETLAVIESAAVL